MNVINKLKEKGINVAEEWVAECIKYLNNKPNFDLVYEQFLYTDLRLIGAGGITKKIADIHNQILDGSYVVQVNQLFNIGEAHEHRLTESSNRCLKLAMTDGKQTFFGFEYKRLSNTIHIHSKPGIKLRIKNVMIKRGILLLEPGNTEILGGAVESLILQQQKEAENTTSKLKPAKPQHDLMDEEPPIKRQAFPTRPQINKPPAPIQSKVSNEQSLVDEIELLDSPAPRKPAYPTRTASKSQIPAVAPNLPASSSSFPFDEEENYQMEYPDPLMYLDDEILDEEDLIAMEIDSLNSSAPPASVLTNSFFSTKKTSGNTLTKSLHSSSSTNSKETSKPSQNMTTLILNNKKPQKSLASAPVLQQEKPIYSFFKSSPKQSSSQEKPLKSANNEDSLIIDLDDSLDSEEDLKDLKVEYLVDLVKSNPASAIIKAAIINAPMNYHLSSVIEIDDGTAVIDVRLAASVVDQLKNSDKTKSISQILLLTEGIMRIEFLPINPFPIITKLIMNPSIQLISSLLHSVRSDVPEALNSPKIEKPKLTVYLSTFKYQSVAGVGGFISSNNQQNISKQFTFSEKLNDRKIEILGVIEILKAFKDYSIELKTSSKPLFNSLTEYFPSWKQKGNFPQFPELWYEIDTLTATSFPIVTLTKSIPEDMFALDEAKQLAQNALDIL